MPDAYEEHVKARRAAKAEPTYSAATVGADPAIMAQLEDAINKGLSDAAASLGVPWAGPTGKVVGLVKQTRDISVGQALVLGAYLMGIASEIMDKASAEE